MTITAKIIQYSIAPNGQMIVTWELEYQRFIHGEFMTHRLFSRNAASSRAIPVETIIAQVRDNPAMPIHWGANQSGMQAKKELSPIMRVGAKWAWKMAALAAVKWAETMVRLGLHKQATNRILEPFQTMKTVMTATSMDNFFWLRNHEDAQPEIRELARCMLEQLDAATPFELKPGEWHVPYVGRVRDCLGNLMYLNGEMPAFSHQTQVIPAVSLEDALAISASCCAQVSYRKLDDTLEKARMVYGRLVGSEPVHASPFEHQATPMSETICEVDGFMGYRRGVNDPHDVQSWESGITHIDRAGNFWSGNLKGFIQHRQLISNNVCNNYEGTNQ